MAENQGGKGGQNGQDDQDDQDGQDDQDDQDGRARKADSARKGGATPSRKGNKTSPGYHPLEGAPDTLVDGAPTVGPTAERHVPPTEKPPAPTAGAAPRKPRGRASQPPAPVPAETRRGTPVLEIEVVHEHGPAPSTDRPFRTVEVWTRNRVYTLDSLLLCVEVMDRATRTVVTEHPFLGMRLVGGQHREGERIELSHPFPRPGTEAVFEQAGPGSRAGGFSRTSAVTRVVLRLHIVTVMPNHVVPTWEDISGSIVPPPPFSPNGDD